MLVVVAAAICRDGRVLVARRAHPPALAGLWELPGGKAAPNESDVAALERECREELGVEIVVNDRVGPDLTIKDGWMLRAYAARLRAGEPRALEHLELHWAEAAELETLDWLPANVVLIPHLRELLRLLALFGCD